MYFCLGSKYRNFHQHFLSLRKVLETLTNTSALSEEPKKNYPFLAARLLATPHTRRSDLIDWVDQAETSSHSTTFLYWSVVIIITPDIYQVFAICQKLYMVLYGVLVPLTVVTNCH